MPATMCRSLDFIDCHNRSD